MSDISGLPVGSVSNEPIKKSRESNLELYRIIVMLLIVAHHYVVNSNLYTVLRDSEPTLASISMLLFGAWGKTGINCFVLITGYFMCRSSITLHKFLKLYLQIIFYAMTFYLIFCIFGYDTFSPIGFIKTLFPVWDIDKDFIGCFMCFYLLIPFLNILIDALDKRQHLTLGILLTGIYTVTPMIGVHLRFNYISWFVVLYVIASYIRIYKAGEGISHRRWGVITLSLVVLASVSIIMMFFLYKAGYGGSYKPYAFVSDSNKILALAVAVSSFMWFKGLRMSYHAIINAVGASTFGILLIHANSENMRQWLWRETVDCAGHFDGTAASSTLMYATASVLVVFTLCFLIEYCRIRLVESHILNPVLSMVRRLSGYRRSIPTE